jgi:hypothetical protein
MEKNIVKLGHIIRKLTKLQLEELNSDEMMSVINDTLNDRVWSEFADFCVNNESCAMDALHKFMYDEIDEEFLHGSDKLIRDLWMADGFWNEDKTNGFEIEYITFDFTYKGKTYQIDCDFNVSMQIRELWACPFNEQTENRMQYICPEWTEDGTEGFEFYLGLKDITNPYSLKLFCKRLNEKCEIIEDLGCEINVKNFYIGCSSDVIQMDNQEE